MRNQIEVDEAANIAVSKMLREIYDYPARRILMLIDAGLSLDEAERIVSEAEPNVVDLAAWREAAA